MNTLTIIGSGDFSVLIALSHFNSSETFPIHHHSDTCDKTVLAIGENTLPITLEKALQILETQAIKDFSLCGNQVISTGGGAVQKIENLELLQNCTIIYLKTSPEVLFARIREDISRPLLQNENPLETLKKLLEKRQENYEKADIIIGTDNKTTIEVVDEIIKNVKS